MPGPAQCNKIQNPKERKKCLAYKGKYAKASPVKGSLNPKKPALGGSGGY